MMKMLRKVLMIIVLVGLSLAQKILRYPYIANGDYMIISLKFDTFKKKFNQPFNNALPSSIINPIGELLRSENFVKVDVIEGRKQNFESYIYRTGIDLEEDTKISNFLFAAITDSSFFNVDNGIGSGYKIKDDKYSLVHQLYNAKKIDHLSFAVKPSADSLDGEIYFGGVPDNEKTLSQYSTKCQVNTNSKFEWGCMLSRVYIGDSIYKNNNYAYFLTSKSRIIFPSSFMNFLLSTKYKALIHQRVCMVQDYEMTFLVLLCKEDSISTLPKFKLVIENSIVEIPNEYLFSCTKGKCLSHFGSYIKTDLDVDTWRFGYPFLKYFSFVNFDYENNQIQFYSNNIKITNNISGFGNAPYKLFFICIIVCLLTTLMLVFFIRKNLKRKNGYLLVEL